MPVLKPKGHGMRRRLSLMALLTFFGGTCVFFFARL
jgi:hypothetical protein